MLAYIPGIVLDDPDDPRLIEALRALHTATQGWPQRPGSLVAHDLLTRGLAGDIDLSSMPPELVREISQFADGIIYQGTVADAHAFGKSSLSSRWETEAINYCGYTQDDVDLALLKADF